MSTGTASELPAATTLAPPAKLKSDDKLIYPQVGSLYVQHASFGSNRTEDSLI
jgi:hypothetical protein